MQEITNNIAKNNYAETKTRGSLNGLSTKESPY